MKYILYITIAICFFITAAGCTPDAQQPQKNAVSRRATKKKARTKKVTAPVSDAVKKPDKEAYSYSSAGKPDPFRPLLADSSIKTKAPAHKRNTAFLTPLQKYELIDLKLVAVVVLDGDPTAMLEDPTGYGYVIRKGVLVGPNDGVVERVTPTGLIIKEKIYNSVGEFESKISTITIQHVE